MLTFLYFVLFSFLIFNGYWWYFYRQHDAQEALGLLLHQFSEESEQLFIAFHSTCTNSAAYNQNTRKFTGVNLSTRFKTKLNKFISCKSCKLTSSSAIENLNGMIQLDIKSSDGHHPAVLENMTVLQKWSISLAEIAIQQQININSLKPLFCLRSLYCISSASAITNLLESTARTWLLSSFLARLKLPIVIDFRLTAISMLQ